nr:hypothetical protein 26 [bacterium]
MSAGDEVQKALFNRLSNFTDLTDIIKGVYDNVTQPINPGDDSLFPYVVVGDDAITEWDTDAELGFTVAITLHTWSRARGRLQTKEIQKQIYNALHRHDLAVNGLHTVGLDFESDQSFIDADGLTRHGVSTYRLTLTEV